MSSKAFLLFLVLLICGQSRYFTIKDRKFYDPKNGQITFHGVNYVEKQFPYATDASQTFIQQMKNWGLNSIRTDVSWPGLFPKKNFINQTYLNYKVDVINKLGKHGIYTLLEFHQDLFSLKFCADGVPQWMIPEEIYHDFANPVAEERAKFDENGDLLNREQYCNNKLPQWAQGYFTYAVNRAFKALYSNQYGLLDAFKQYWKIVAKTFKGNPYIIGYEIINEPWPGNYRKNPLCMIPGLSQKFNLQGFHDQVARAIREEDPDQNIGFQPVTWLNVIPAGYSHAPGGKQFADRSFLCFHYYKPPTLNMQMFMGARKLDMKRLKVGGLLTEFMTADWAPSDPQHLQPQIMDMCDKYQVGWFAWRYCGSLNREAIVRVYAHRVGGTIVQQSYNTKKNLYLLYYESRQETGQTIIFFPKSHYPHGFILSIDPKVKYEIADQMYIIIDSKYLGNRFVSVKIQKIQQPQKKEENKQQQSMMKMEEKQQHKSKDNVMKEQL